TRRVTRIVWWVSYSWIWAVYSPYPGVLTSLAPDLWTDQKPGFQAVSFICLFFLFLGKQGTTLHSHIRFLEHHRTTRHRPLRK
ncbi:hypothetical protein DFH09DRAFT_1157998, partial [Mycena vulgaris]